MTVDCTPWMSLSWFLVSSHVLLLVFFLDLFRLNCNHQERELGCPLFRTWIFASFGKVKQLQNVVSFIFFPILCAFPSVAAAGRSGNTETGSTLHVGQRWLIRPVLKWPGICTKNHLKFSSTFLLLEEEWRSTVKSTIHDLFYITCYAHTQASRSSCKQKLDRSKASLTAAIDEKISCLCHSLNHFNRGLSWAISKIKRNLQQHRYRSLLHIDQADLQKRSKIAQ